MVAGEGYKQQATATMPAQSKNRDTGGVPEFDESNFRNWKTHFRSYLITKDRAHRALDEPRPQVDDEELNYRREYDDHHGTRRAAKYERRVAHDARKWDLRNENVYAALLRSVKHHVEANLLASATKFGEGCALWTRLVQRFEPKDQTILQAELAKFNRLEQNPNEKATDFVTRIETSRQILAGFDFVVNPNVEMLNRVKHGLTSPEYDSFRMALFMVDDLTWDKAVSKIKAFDTDIKAGMKRKQGDLVEAGLATSKYCPKCRAFAQSLGMLEVTSPIEA